MSLYLAACLYVAELIFLMLGVIYLPLHSYLMESNGLFSQEVLIKLKPVFFYSLSALFCFSTLFVKKYNFSKSINLLIFGRNLSNYEDIVYFIVKSFAGMFLLLSVAMLLAAELLSTDGWINFKLYFGLLVALVTPLLIIFLLSKQGKLFEFSRYLDVDIIYKSRKLVLISLPCLFVVGFISATGNSFLVLISILIGYVALYYWIKLCVSESGKSVSSSMIMGFFMLAPVYALFFFKKLNDSWLLAFRDTLKLYIYFCVSMSLAVSGAMLALPHPA